MKNYVHKLYAVLLPSLILLFVFGTIGNVRANDNAIDYKDVKDIIAIYPLNSDENTEVTPNEWLYFHGEIIKVKDCFVDFKASDGQRYKIPGSDIMGYRLDDPSSELELPLMEMIMNPSENCSAGTMDAQMFHKKAVGNYFGGVLLGVFWVIGAATWTPGPEDGRYTYLMSKNADLFTDPYYLDCYKKKAKGQNVGAALAGWGTKLLAVILILAGSFSG